MRLTFSRYVHVEIEGSARKYIGVGMAVYRQDNLYKDHVSNPIPTSMIVGFAGNSMVKNHVSFLHGDVCSMAVIGVIMCVCMCVCVRTVGQ